MKKFKVYVSYQVECNATGYVEVEADNAEKAMEMAESGDYDIDNIDIEEQSIFGRIDATDVDETF